MRVLVTGGTGYLGSKLVKRFLNDQHEVLCVIVRESDMLYLSGYEDKIAFVITDDEKMEKSIINFNPEAVVHTACAYERNGVGFQQMLDANFLFPLKILQICFECNVRIWINTDTALPHSFNKYSLLKHQFSEWGKIYSQMESISFVNMRLEHFYGPDAPMHHFLSWVTDKLLNNEELKLTAGQQKRDFVYIQDIISIYSRVLNMDLRGYLDLAIGTGITPSIREVVEYLYEISDSRSRLLFGVVPLRDNEPTSNADLTAMRYLGLDCPTYWKNGMKQLLKETR